MRRHPPYRHAKGQENTGLAKACPVNSVDQGMALGTIGQ